MTPSRFIGSTPGLSDWAWAALGLAISTNALFPLLANASEAPAVAFSDRRVTFAWLVIYAFAIRAILRRIHLAQAIILGCGLPFGIVALALTSSLWSADASQSAYRATTLGLATVFALALAVTFTGSQFAVLLGTVTIVIVALSAILAVAIPSYGLDPIRNDYWRGVFLTKNELGRIASLCALIWALAALQSRARLGCIVMAAFSGLTAWEAGSKTAIGVLAVACLYVLVVPVLRGDPNIAAAGIAFLMAGVVAAAAWLVPNASTVLSSIGGDSTFTGRNSIWAAVWQAIRQHEWLGYGYNAFWNGFAGPSAAIWNVVPSHPPHSHNGFLDTWLELGIVGLAAVACLLLVMVMRAARALRTDRSLGGSLPLALIIFVVAYNVTESTLVPRVSLFWIALIAVAFGQEVRAPLGDSVPARLPQQARDVPHQLQPAR